MVDQDKTNGNWAQKLGADLAEEMLWLGADSSDDDD